MKTVEIDVADFRTLVEEAAAGSEIIIAKAGKPLAHLMPLPEKDFRSTLGALKGQIWIDDDRFDDPLPPDLLKAFGVE